MPSHAWKTRNKKNRNDFSTRGSSVCWGSQTRPAGWERLSHRRRERRLEKKTLEEEPESAQAPKSLGKRELVEAILFVTREPISARKLASLAELDDPTEARTIARQLNELYDTEQFAFRIEEVAGGMQILTRPQFAPWLRRLELVPPETVLSASMLETLAIIAYRQPVARSEIEAIRGVGSDEALRQLMQRNLVRIEGRSEDLGRAYLYGTTKQFLQLFGLQSLDFLPRAQKIREAEAEIATRISVLPTMSTSSREVDAEPGLEMEEKIVP
ncbi:MAG: SMC-Scp complex subunit ScpB [Pirellula sp.]|jgi:segregation and condensation protein B|nr:SMC-Scp complex subunit ScpB [Pirellula sp.]